MWHQKNPPWPHQYNTINQIHTDENLKPTYENNGCISFLDLLIIRKQPNLEIDIFRKPTTTDKIIHFLSNHPIEHKVAAVRYHITRMHSLPLTPKRIQKEWTLIQLIVQNNNFPQKPLQKPNFEIQHKQTNQDQINERNKKQNMDNIHILQPHIKKNQQLIEAHRCEKIP